MDANHDGQADLRELTLALGKLNPELPLSEAKDSATDFFVLFKVDLSRWAAVLDVSLAIACICIGWLVYLAGTHKDDEVGPGQDEHLVPTLVCYLHTGPVQNVAMRHYLPLQRPGQGPLQAPPAVLGADAHGAPAQDGPRLGAAFERPVPDVICSQQVRAQNFPLHNASRCTVHVPKPPAQSPHLSYTIILLPKAGLDQL